MDSSTSRPSRSARGTLRLPGSKSISNRALLLAALAAARRRSPALLDSDDTRVMLGALATLGVASKRSTAEHVRVRGVGGRVPAKRAGAFLGNAGTAVRPLAAALAFAGGHYELAGVPRMHERPIGDLVDALRQLGARIDYLGDDGLSRRSRSARAARRRGDAGSRPRRRVEPVPHRAADGAAAARQAVAVEIQGELISQAVRGPHART